jgi:hypothetical protein
MHVFANLLQEMNVFSGILQACRTLNLLILQTSELATVCTWHISVCGNRARSQMEDRTIKSTLLHSSDGYADTTLKSLHKPCSPCSPCSPCTTLKFAVNGFGHLVHTVACVVYEQSSLNHLCHALLQKCSGCQRCYRQI